MAAHYRTQDAVKNLMGQTARAARREGFVRQARAAAQAGRQKRRV